MLLIIRPASMGAQRAQRAQLGHLHFICQLFASLFDKHTAHFPMHHIVVSIIAILKPQISFLEATA